MRNLWEYQGKKFRGNWELKKLRPGTCDDPEESASRRGGHGLYMKDGAPQ